MEFYDTYYMTIKFTPGFILNCVWWCFIVKAHLVGEI